MASPAAWQGVGGQIVLMNQPAPVLEQILSDVPKTEIPKSPLSTPVSSFRGLSPEATIPS